jgi:hypothetical protein
MLVASVLVTKVSLKIYRTFVSRSFSTAEIQQFRTENKQSDYKQRILMIYMWLTGKQLL